MFRDRLTAPVPSACPRSGERGRSCRYRTRSSHPCSRADPAATTALVSGPMGRGVRRSVPSPTCKPRSSSVPRSVVSAGVTPIQNASSCPTGSRNPPSGPGRERAQARGRRHDPASGGPGVALERHEPRSQAHAGRAARPCLVRVLRNLTVHGGPRATSPRRPPPRA